MKKLLGFVLVVHFSCFCMPSMAQPPVTLWSEFYGGENSDDLQFTQELVSGDLISGGYTFSIAPGGSQWSYNYWLMKINSLGDVIWDHVWGTDANQHIYGGKVSSDGGVILVGRCENEDTGFSICLIKTDSEGEVLWDQNYNNRYSGSGVDVIQTEDSGFVVLGSTGSDSSNTDYRLIKVNSQGSVEWDYSYGGTYTDSPACLCPTSDGGYVMVGYTRSFTPGYAWAGWMIKTDSNGIEQWNRVFEAGDAGEFYSVSPTSDDGFIITGYRDGDTVDNYVWVVKTNFEGVEEWSQTYSCQSDSKGRSIQQTNDGGYILVAGTGIWGDSSTRDCWVMKIDPDGHIDWDSSFGEDGDAEYGISICQTMDGGYIVTGNKSNNNYNEQGWIIRLEGNEMPLQPFSLLLPANEEVMELLDPYEVNLDWEIAVDPNPSVVSYDLTIHAQATGYDSTIVRSSLEASEFTLSLPYHLGLVEWDDTINVDWCVIAYSNGDTVSCDTAFTFDILPYNDVAETPRNNLPGTHLISSIYPNPFNAYTTIEVMLPEASDLEITVCNINGQQLSSISKGYFSEGIHTFTINAASYSSGIHFVTASIRGKTTDTRKILLIK